MPTDKVTSAVDYDIKKAYESTFERGKAVYKEMIEEGMLRRIEEFNPKQACKLRIERFKQLLAEEEAKLLDIEEFERMEKINRKKSVKKVVNPNIEKTRLEKYEPIKHNIATQVMKGNIDWKRVSDAFFFDSVNEAKEWTISKLQEECLID